MGWEKLKIILRAVKFPAGIVWQFVISHVEFQGAMSEYNFSAISYQMVNFSSMLPKLFRTYPHREEDWGIAMVSLLLWLILLKAFSTQLKIFANLTFSQKVWPLCLFWFTLRWAESAVSAVEKKWHFGFVVAKMPIFDHEFTTRFLCCMYVIRWFANLTKGPEA